MGYGKKGKKGKNALLYEYEELRSQRVVGFVALGGGIIVIILALIIPNLLPLVMADLGEDASFSFMIAGFVGTFIGAVLAALGCIRLFQVSEDFRRVKSKLNM